MSVDDQYVDVPIFSLTTHRAIANIAELQRRDSNLAEIIDALIDPQSADNAALRKSRSYFLDADVLYC